MKTNIFITMMIALFIINEAVGQWTTSGSNIYNTNIGNVGIGNNAPATMLHVAKFMTEPTITIQNLGGVGGATYSMMDNVSGANWKFKATNSGGFKIRDHANALDVFVIEPNSAANTIYINSEGSVGIGTATPNNSAAIDISSSTKGLLPPRMTQAQIGAILSPADGLIVYSTTDQKLYTFVSSANVWKEILFGPGVIAPPFSCGNQLIINHVAGNVSPVTKTVTYGTISNVPGEPAKCWITSNLGSDHQANAVNDATEASAGWYWQFNRMQGYKHDGTNRTPNTTWISPINETLDWQAANDPCALELGNGWRLPTVSEFNNVDLSGNWNDWNGPWSSALKMHAAGYLYFNEGPLLSRGEFGLYWSSTQGGSTHGWYLHFGNGNCYTYNNYKALGNSIRCVID
jgi:hypothetical protein